MKPNYKIYQFILLLVCLIIQKSSAQYTVNLLLNNRPPSYLSDWNSGQAGQLIITYTGTMPTQVKFATQLIDENGSVIARSNNSMAQLQNIIIGANVFRLDRVLQLENMMFQNMNSVLARSGKLTAGQYSLTLQLLNPINDSTLSEIQKRTFTQVNYQLPFLLSPADKVWLDANVAQTVITFRWSSLLPVTQEQTTYRLQVYEILESQTPMQALRSNQPILLTDLHRTTQYIWRPQLALKDTSLHTFIWTVQSLDSKGILIEGQDKNNEGRSEPSLFGVCNMKGVNGTTCGDNYTW